MEKDPKDPGKAVASSTAQDNSLTQTMPGHEVFDLGSFLAVASQVRWDSRRGFRATGMAYERPPSRLDRIRFAPRSRRSPAAPARVPMWSC